MAYRVVALAGVCAIGLGLSPLAWSKQCPAKGFSFKRVNAGFEAVLVSEGQGGDPNNLSYCKFTDKASGSSAFYVLQAYDSPLDPVPKQKSGTCPVGAKAEYTIVLTTYTDKILAGPDSAGRCLIRSDKGSEKWEYAADLKILGGGSGASSPSGMDLSGRWRCSANGNIPIAVLSFSGERYTLEDTPNTQWKKRAGKLNGSGKLDLGNMQFSPQSGPLVAELGIQNATYSASNGRRAIYLNNKPGGLSLLQCLPEG